MLAAAGRCTGNQRMPSLARRDQDAIDVGACHQFPIVVVLSARCIAVALIDCGRASFPGGLLHVADSGDMDILLREKAPHIAASLPPHTNSAHHDLFTWCDVTIASQCGRRNDRGKAGDNPTHEAFHEITAPTHHEDSLLTSSTSP